jgi:hypothetical protein
MPERKQQPDEEERRREKDEREEGDLGPQREIGQPLRNRVVKGERAEKS